MQSVPDSQNAGSISHAQCPSGLRRRLIAAAVAVTFSGLAVFGPAFAAAEAPLIGVVQLVDHEALNDSVRGITDGLKARGLAGSLDLQNAHGDQSTLKTIGDRFVHKDAKLIFAVATPAVQAMARATKTIPIVGAAVTSYTAAKVIASNEHPGGNVTGVSNIGPVAAQLDLFMKLVPNAKRVGTIYNAGEINSVVQIELLRAAAEQRGIELEEATVTNLTDLQSAVVSMSKKVDGFVFPTDNVVVAGMAVVLRTTVPAHQVTVSGDMGSLAAGCTAAMTVDYYKLGLQAAQLGADILEGRTTAAETPIGVQDVKNPTFTVTAMKRLGLEIPEDLKAGALLWQKK